MGGELTPRDRVGYSERIVWELICRKSWMLFLEPGGTFELFLVVTFQEHPHSILISTQERGNFSFTDCTNIVKMS